MVSGGVQLLQLRAKSREIGKILPLARELAKLCRDHQVPFILNDHPELVLECGANGAHVGQDDMSVAEARQLVGEHAIIGKSTHSTGAGRRRRAGKARLHRFRPALLLPRPNPTICPLVWTRSAQSKTSFLFPFSALVGSSGRIFHWSSRQARAGWSLFPEFCRRRIRADTVGIAGVFWPPLD